MSKRHNLEQREFFLQSIKIRNFLNLITNKMSEYSDLDRQIEQLKRCEIIKENEVKALCAKAREILVEEGNVQRVDSPVTVSIAFFRHTHHFLLSSLMTH